MDNLQYFCDAGGPKKRHLVCLPYSVNNLHQMAKNLAIARCWYHGGDKPHYDIPAQRQIEIQNRCTIVSTRRILEIITTGK